MEYLFQLEEGIQIILEASSLDDAKKKFKIRLKEEGIAVKELTGFKEEKQSKAPKGLSENIIALKGEGFFNTPRALGEIKEKLTELAIHYPITSFPPYLNRLVGQRVLRRFKGKKDGKEAWVYVNN